MKVFVDGGANNGSSVALFRKSFEGGDKFNIYCFEPNPSMHNCFESLNVTFLPYAIWINDGDVKFYRGKNPHSMSSSVYKKKTTGNLLKEPISVPCINFNRWLMKTFTNNDYVIVKLDIEGAEYEVLEHMLQEDGIRLIKELYIDWHYNKVGIPVARHRKLVASLKRIGLQPKKWSTESGQFGKNAD